MHAELILNGEPEEYLKNAAGNHALILQEYLARATAAAGVTNVRYS